MIPAKADDEQMAHYIANITAAYDAATLEQRDRGRNWYPVAHDLALIIGDGDVRKGAGILAVFSANKRWRDTVRLAQDASDGFLHGHTGVTLAKAARITAGEDPALVLPPDAKTGHFYRAILDPSDPDPVVIDRHAHDIAVGEVYGNRDRGLSSKSRYATLAHAYRVAARDLGEIPGVAQAVTWVRQLALLDGTSTRGKTTDE